MTNALESLRAHLPAVSDAAWEQLALWAELMREWNERVNLVSRKDIDQLERHHLAPCLAVTGMLKLMHGARVIDVGTGGGLPGVPMAICYPQARFTLVDSVGKKIRVVEDIVKRLGLKNVEVRNCRVETIKTKYDFVTGRAVTDLAAFINWIRPLCRKGKTHSLPNGLLYWRGGDVQAEAAGLHSRLTRSLGLEEVLADTYFKDKYILQFKAEDLRREEPATRA
ncbi:16S rRNA (guanine(527)-N(7))-methyltransferase RsmG [Ruficoccus sp. ZRK36]|uniref:16S rRNA (guanine(527)-N(7))-methyltransferase RsmG n=1 Tax=Ruficoccus sp. ZRK36 TaxID=2866311 RepID=UPI0021076FE9|nr:16S rRNA (guanine(527)-N(7))-methyltransferase RsmG [Ruficoccus sp. ZRK36]